MDRPTFEDLMEQAFQRLRDLNSTKGREYSGDTDVLSDFKDIADAVGISPEQALITYATKHWRAINSYVQHGAVLSEPISGRIDDLILYMHLLNGLIQDKSNTGVSASRETESLRAGLFDNPRPITDDLQPMTWRTAKLLGRPWQDLVFAAGEVIFLVALLPLLFTDARIPTYTGISTGVMLYLFGLCQLSYRNWITLALGLTTATIWVLLGLGVHL